MYTISKETKKNIERVVGLPIEKLFSMTALEEQEWILEKSNGGIKFSKKRRYGIVGRGNPLLSRRKIRTKEDLERKSKKYFGI